MTRLASVLVLAAATAGMAAAGAGPALAQTPGFTAAPQQDISAVDRLEAESIDLIGRLIAEEREAAASGTLPGEETFVALRTALDELASASMGVGRDIAAVERRLSYAALKRFGREVPGQLTDDRGMLNVRGLLGLPPQRAGADPYLSAVMSEGTSTRLQGGPGGGLGGSLAAAPAPTPAPTAPAPAATPTPSAAPAAPAPARVDTAERSTRVERAQGRRFVTVRQGDTLGSLALEVYGDVLSYRQIYAANRDVLSNPGLLIPGQRLVLPD